MKITKIFICVAVALCVAVSACGLSFAAAAKAGDVDFDGVVTAEDALLVLQVTSGTRTLTAAQKKVADVTYDGKVNSVDALRILFYVSGTVSSLEKLGSDEGDDLII